MGSSRTEGRKRLPLAFAVGLASSLAVAQRLGVPDWRYAVPLVVLVLSTAALSAFWWASLIDWIRVSWHAAPRRRARLTLLACAGAALLASVAAPFEAAPAQPVEFSVEPTGDAAPGAVSSEVWVSLLIDGQAVPMSSFSGTDGWVTREAFWVWGPPSPRTVLRWSGTAASTAELVFVRHDWSGSARLTTPEGQQVVPLYSEAPGELRVSLLQKQSLTFLPAFVRPVRVFVFDLITSGVLALLLFALVARLTFPSVSSHREPAQSLAFETWSYAVPMLWVGAWLLGVFSPGVMTVDSVGQWAQALTMNVNDAHPVAHTLLMAGLMRVWNSPAAVAIPQLLGLALANGALIAVLRRAVSAPVWAARLAACALHPMVAVTSVTLWKDVPYTVALVALAAWVCARVLLSPTERPSTASAVGVGVIAFFAMMLRHNGPPAVVVALVVVAVLVPASRKAVVISSATALSLMLLLKGPVSWGMKLQSARIAHFFFVHRIAAHLAAGQSPEAAADRALLSEIEPDPGWHYGCSLINGTVFAPSFKLNLSADHTSDLARIWRELALAHPRVELNHAACVSSIVWRVDPRDAPAVYLYTVGIEVLGGDVVRWIEPGVSELQQSSLFPVATQRVGRTLKDSSAWWFWRPATWLYLLTFAAVIAALRARDPRPLVVLLIPWAHSLVLGAINVAQDARYQLPVYVMGVALAPLLLTTRRAPAESPSSPS